MSALAVIGSADTGYMRRVVRGLCEQGHPPTIVLLGSRSERLRFKIQSFRRIRSRLGLREAVGRMLRKRRPKMTDRVPEPGLEDLSARYGFRIVPYDAVNIGSMLVEVFELPGCVTVLAGCGIVDEALLLASRGGCVNGHPALLPGLRGVDVLEWSLVKDVPFGVTAHLVDPSVDAGHILQTKPLTPEIGESYDRFSERLVEAQADVLAQATVDLINQKSQPAPHDLAFSTLCFVAPADVSRRARSIYDAKYGTPKQHEN